MTSPSLLTCARSTRQAHAPLYGTAPHAEVWLLLEYPQRWAKNATAKADLPAAAKQWFLNALATIPNARWQFIKQTERSDLSDLTFYIAIPTLPQPRLYRLTLPTLEAVQEVDLVGLLQDTAFASPYRTDEKLTLVCTNAEHDACCGQYGIALYETLRQQTAITTWQTSHLGGHRYAATLVTFPEGVYYGQVTEEDVPALVEAQVTQQVYLPRLRGRSAYEEAAQAGEYFLRQQTGNFAHAAYRLVEQITAGECTTLNWLDATNTALQITVERTLSPFTLITSCDKPDEARLPIFRLVTT